MKRRIVKLILISGLSFFVFAPPLRAQESLRCIDSLKIPRFQQVRQDSRGQIYLVQEDGVIQRYDASFKPQEVYAPTRVADLHYIDLSATLRVFLFYRDLQCYEFLNRFLVSTGEYCLALDQVGFAQAMSPSADNAFWVFDNSDLSLKKINPRSNELLIHNPLSLLIDEAAYSIESIQEYQNQVFIWQEGEAFWVFDNLGNYQNKIESMGYAYYSFFEEELVLGNAEELKLIYLYQEKEELLPLQANWNIDYCLKIAPNKFLGFSKKNQMVYTLVLNK